MQPRRTSQATVEDLLERVLDRGIVVKLDLVVGVAGIPLIGISLQGAIAAIETMLEYGMMEAWDADTRAHACGAVQRQQPGLEPGEHVMFESYGSHHHARGIYRAWRPGRLILTDRRLLLLRRTPPEVLFEARVSAIAGFGRTVCGGAGEARREIVCVALADGSLAALYAAKPDILEAGLRERLARLGQPVAEISRADLARLGLAAVAEGQLWCRRAPASGPALWQSGWAVLTATDLTWRADAAARASVRIPLGQIWGLAVEPRGQAAPGDRAVLVVAHGASGQRAETLLAGEGVDGWSAAIRRAALAPGGGGDARH